MMTMMFVAALVCALVVFEFARGSEGGGAGGEANRLIHETSPYLLQHAHNPVDWHAWGREAFEKARRENKPVFLSVGYSTCHWCHVMERESFEREDVAKVLNEHFVSIKVDREERPDVDEQYMLATQLFTQRGGWPNSVFLTPDGRPWYAGTYFPRQRFIPLLLELSRVFAEQREQVEEQAERFAAAIRQVGAGRRRGSERSLSEAVVDEAAAMFRGNYDARNGGFGTAPKFPPHGALALLLNRQASKPDARALGIVTHTLEAMAMGGVYDHVGGGFHRYATDAKWFLPHFEKMLYDNAQLIGSYAEAYELTKDEGYRRVIAETYAWLAREMTDGAGGFYSAVDADSEGEEGKFYVWSYRELLEVLGENDGKLLGGVYGATEAGNYFEEATRERTGANVLYLSEPLEEIAREKQLGGAQLREKLAILRGRLLEARDKRVRPHLDDKVISGWNGLMIAGLARAGAVLGERRYTDAAGKAAAFVLGSMRGVEGGLLRTWRKGEAKLAAYLDDYAFMIDGLVELHTATGEARWLEEARGLAEIVFADFHDARRGGFYMTSAAHDALLMRAKEIGAGGNIPSGNGVMARGLIRLALATGERRYADAAAGTLHCFGGMMASQPLGAEALVVALAEFYAAQAQRPGLFDLPQTAGMEGDAAATQGPVTIEAFASTDRVAPGHGLRVALRLSFEGNYHVYAHTLRQRALIPTTVAVEKGGAFVLGDVRYPRPTEMRDPVLGEVIAVYGDGAVIVAEAQAPADNGAGEQKLTIKIRAQACNDEQCLAPEVYTLEIPVTIDPAAAGAKQDRHAEVFTEVEG